MDEHTKWCLGLKSSGLYKERAIDGSHLESPLETHRRETANTVVHVGHPEVQHCRHCKATTVCGSAQSDCDSKENVSVYYISIMVV